MRPYNTHKLDFRSNEYTFLGYSAKQKGFRCLTSNGKIIISRHVIFNERDFPFANPDIVTTKKVYNPKTTPIIPLYKSNNTDSEKNCTHDTTNNTTHTHAHAHMQNTLSTGNSGNSMHEDTTTGSYN